MMLIQNGNLDVTISHVLLLIFFFKNFLSRVNSSSKISYFLIFVVQCTKEDYNYASKMTNNLVLDFISIFNVSNSIMS